MAGRQAKLPPSGCEARRKGDAPVEQASDAPRALLVALEAHIVTLKETTAKAEADTNKERDGRTPNVNGRTLNGTAQTNSDGMTDDAAGLRWRSGRFGPPR